MSNGTGRCVQHMLDQQTGMLGVYYVSALCQVGHYNTYSIEASRPNLPRMNGKFDHFHKRFTKYAKHGLSQFFHGHNLGTKIDIVDGG